MDEMHMQHGSCVARNTASAAVCPRAAGGVSAAHCCSTYTLPRKSGLSVSWLVSATTVSSAGGGPSTAAPNTCEACRRHPSASVRGRPARSIKRERRTRDGARDRRAGMGGSGPAAGSAERGTAGEHGRTCLVSLPRPPLMLWAESRSQSLAACASAPALRPPAPAARPALRGPAARPAPRPRRADMPLPCSEILRRLRASSVVLVVLAQLIPPGSSHCQLQGDQV